MNKSTQRNNTFLHASFREDREVLEDQSSLEWWEGTHKHYEHYGSFEQTLNRYGRGLPNAKSKIVTWQNCEASSFKIARCDSFIADGFVIVNSLKTIYFDLDALNYQIEPVNNIVEFPSVDHGVAISEAQHPWQMNKSHVEVVKTYSAKIVDEAEEDYAIEFYDDDASVVEASMPKERFNDLPYSVKSGTHFWIVVYRMNDQQDTRVSVWPVAQFWHESW